MPSATVQCAGESVEVLTMTFPTAEELEAKRSAALRGFPEPISRVQQTGRLRPEFCQQAVRSS